jgi:hypothetical protein
MQYLILAGIILFSLLIAFQDFKSRSVSVLYLVCFTVVSALYGIAQFQVLPMLNYLLFNFCFLLLQFFVLLLYYFIKYRNIKVLVNSIGGADVWTLLALAFSFDLVGFILFVCIGFILAITYYLISNTILKIYMREIPLAGILSLCYLFFSLFNSL